MLEPVALRAEVADGGQHPRQQKVSRGRGDPRPLKRKDFPALPPELDPHAFDFSPDVVEIRHFTPIRVEG